MDETGNRVKQNKPDTRQISPMWNPDILKA
jgi:hypothetical protein